MPLGTLVITGKTAKVIDVTPRRGVGSLSPPPGFSHPKTKGEEKQEQSHEEPIHAPQNGSGLKL